MADNGFALAEHHESQIQHFSRFAKLRLTQHLREFEIAVDDFRDLKVLENEVYNSEDLVEMLRELKEDVRAAADKEMSNAYCTATLSLRLLLLQAERQGLRLLVDTDLLQNERLLSQSATSPGSAQKPLDDLLRSPDAASPSLRPVRLSRLASLERPPQGLQANGVSDGEKERLTQELSDVRGKLETLQVQTTKAMRARTEQNEAMRNLQRRLQEKEEELSDARKRLLEDGKDRREQPRAEDCRQSSSGQMNELADRCEGLEGELEVTRKELMETKDELKAKVLEVKKAENAVTTKLSTSKQFQAMKAMMQQKSKEVVELRRRLARYETADVKDADAEDEFSY